MHGSWVLLWWRGSFWWFGVVLRFIPENACIGRAIVVSLLGVEGTSTMLEKRGGGLSEVYQEVQLDSVRSLKKFSPWVHILSFFKVWR
jgi:hypothetical protein